MGHLNKNLAPLYLKTEEKEQLDLYADVLGISRQKLLEAIIASSLRDLITLDKLDVLISEVDALDQLEMFKSALRLENVFKDTANTNMN